MPNSHLVFRSALAVMLLSTSQVLSQGSSFSQIRGTLDTIAAPQQRISASQHDPGAVQEITAFQKAIALVPWTDFKATGTISLSAANGTAQPATLWIRGQEESRLDVSSSTGTYSFRYAAEYGAAKRADGPIESMDARDAAGGLVAFPVLISPSFTVASANLVDQGYQVLDGVPTHRLTLGKPWAASTPDSTGQIPTTVIDCYFDSQTHLLSKTATAILGSRPSQERMLRVVTYSDYRTVGGIQIPYQYRLTLNGQLLWTLQLSQVEVNVGLTDSDFVF